MKIPLTESATLRLPHIVALYVGSVLGCGILILPGLAADLAGPGSLISWITIIILALPIALTMGLLSAQYPNDGGVSYFVSRAFNTDIGSLIGWFFLLSGIIGVPVLALTGAGYICAAFGFSECMRILIAAGIIALGIVLNYIGMRITSQVQIIVVSSTIIILIWAFLGSYQAVSIENFYPVIPNGWFSIGQATTLLFWSYIGWEAVTHIAEEFEDPKRDVVRGTLIASVIIGILYFLSAFVVVGTHTYGPGISEVSLLYVIRISFGTLGTLFIGITAFLVCIAPSIAYISAASRLSYSLAVTGYAPRYLARLSPRFYTHIGGLHFLTVCFAGILIVYGTHLFSITTLIQLPNATFILTYLGGCAAGVVLLKDSRLGVFVSVLSLVMTMVLFLFVSWAVLFPLTITACWGLYIVHRKKRDIRLC